MVSDLIWRIQAWFTILLLKKGSGLFFKVAASIVAELIDFKK
jgi:hypothetical protein